MTSNYVNNKRQQYLTYISHPEKCVVCLRTYPWVLMLGDCDNGCIVPLMCITLQRYLVNAVEAVNAPRIRRHLNINIICFLTVRTTNNIAIGPSLWLSHPRLFPAGSPALSLGIQTHTACGLLSLPYSHDGCHAPPIQTIWAKPSSGSFCLALDERLFYSISPLQRADLVLRQP